MASFKVEGLDELIDDIERMGAGLDPVFEEMLDAGADEIVKAWEAAIVKHKHVITGQMLESVKSSKKKVGGAKQRLAEIFPHGKDERGIRNASKAFYCHFGTSKRPGTHFIDTAEEEGHRAAFEKVSQIWDRFITEGGNGR
jgi:HK97 gp10 family phage protein